MTDVRSTCDSHAVSDSGASGAAGWGIGVKATGAAQIQSTDTGMM